MSAADPPASVGLAERWLARAACLSAFAAVVALVVGGAKSLVVLAVGVAGLAVALAGVWWCLSRRGLARAFGAFVAVAAPITVVTVYLLRDVVLPIVLVVVLSLIALGAARAALVRGVSAAGMPERAAPGPRHPFLIMNPRSGGGKVVRFGLEAEAKALGAQVALLAGPEHVDVAALARVAVAAGADLLGVAGGDGTQALVAGIAADHDVPFLVLSAGTRNHFAMDLGLDREDPRSGFQALTDGVEITLDLGMVGGRTFVNNASFGVYADIVQSPSYRADKRGTTLQMLPDLLSGHRGPHLVARIDGEVTVDGPKAILSATTRINCTISRAWVGANGSIAGCSESSRSLSTAPPRPRRCCAFSATAVCASTARTRSSSMPTPSRYRSGSTGSRCCYRRRCVATSALARCGYGYLASALPPRPASTWHC